MRLSISGFPAAICGQYVAHRVGVRVGGSSAISAILGDGEDEPGDESSRPRRLEGVVVECCHRHVVS